MTKRWTRRQFVGRAGAAALATGFPAIRAVGAPVQFRSDPFQLGVASGYPDAESVVLWTRLAPEPLLGGGMPPEPVDVAWEVSSDEGFGANVREGVTRALPASAHSVHVEVQGLEPDRWYFYRFRAGGTESPVGRTRTAPSPGASLDRLRFAFASCQHYEQGYFAAYRDMAAQDLDLIVHLGDYIYESSWGVNHVRKHPEPEPFTLDDYRNRYALYRSDPNLRAAHAAAPWLVTWDDHEVDNDYANARSEQLDPEAWFLARRAAAYQAYYEHMPLRRGAVPLGAHMKLYAQTSFGSLASFLMLDDRQYRSPQVCPPKGEGGSTNVTGCQARLDPGLTLLGATQEQWLENRLERSDAKWNVLGQQTLMAQLDQAIGGGRNFWTDGWDGYPAARRRLLSFLEEARTSNPLVLGGDVHSFWVSDLKTDFDDPRAATVATEFVCSSVTSQTGRTAARARELKAENGHIGYVDVERRGYALTELTPERSITELRAVSDVTDPEATVERLASFVVEDGQPGAQLT